MKISSYTAWIGALAYYLIVRHLQARDECESTKMFCLMNDPLSSYDGNSSVCFDIQPDVMLDSIGACCHMSYRLLTIDHVAGHRLEFGANQDTLKIFAQNLAESYGSIIKKVRLE